MVALTAGKTLRLIALEKLGSKEFWIYLYLKNKVRIKNPNIVPVGTQLTIPDVSEYDMNASDLSSIAKAKELGEAEIRKWKK